MEVCCLKMASRCRPLRAVQMDAARLPTISSTHDCGSLSRVVMVRKTDQRMINHKSPQADPQCEFVTFETIQTYKGHRPDRTVVFTEKHDLNESDVQKSPSAQRFMRGSSVQSGIQSLSISSNDLHRLGKAGSPLRSHQPHQRPASTNNLQQHQFASAQPLYNGSRSATPVRTGISYRQSVQSPILRKNVSGYSEFERDCLRAHNEFRTKHGVATLRLNKKLCKFAEEWAKVIAARGTPAHRNNSPYGENIFCSWSSNAAVTVEGCEPAEHWYSEGVNHIFGKEPTTLKTGHFTQVVWKDSRELGVGMAKNRSGQVFVVANYDPPGNFIGSFSENVPPIGGFVDPTPVISNSLLISSTDSTQMDSLGSAGSADSSSREMDLDKFVAAMLRYHNEYRRKHGSPELKLNDQLRILSQDWAETLAREDRFAYRPNSNHGENIYCLWSSDRNAKANPKSVCRSWYDELRDHTFGNEPKGAFRAGHFTQMVWKESRELGVGVAKTRKGKVLVVCNYSPRGNVVGQFCANVLRSR